MVALGMAAVFPHWVILALYMGAIPFVFLVLSLQEWTNKKR